jgi:hypothetical protein
MDHTIVAYQPQVVASVTTDVRHDVTVDHPLGDHRESPALKGVRDSNEIENVWMGQALPQGNFFAEPLHSV